MLSQPNELSHILLVLQVGEAVVSYLTLSHGRGCILRPSLVRGCSMQIGQVAAQAGVSVQTVRLYERLGLITQVERRPLGH
jgi:MerR family regulatory protein